MIVLVLNPENAFSVPATALSFVLEYAILCRLIQFALISVAPAAFHPIATWPIDISSPSTIPIALLTVGLSTPYLDGSSSCSFPG